MTMIERLYRECQITSLNDSDMVIIQSALVNRQIAFDNIGKPVAFVSNPVTDNKHVYEMGSGLEVKIDLNSGTYCTEELGVILIHDIFLLYLRQETNWEPPTNNLSTNL